MLIHTKTHESPLTHIMALPQRPQEREKGKTPTPIHTKIHTSSRALWLIDRRVGLGFWGNENQIGKRVIFSEWVWGMGFCGFGVLREWESDREESDFQWVGLGYGVLWWCWLRFTMEVLLRWDWWDRRGKRVIFNEESWWLRRLRLRLIEERVMKARPWLVFGFWRKLQIGKTEKGELGVGEMKKRKKKLFNKMVHKRC